MVNENNFDSAKFVGVLGILASLDGVVFENPVRLTGLDSSKEHALLQMKTARWMQTNHEKIENRKTECGPQIVFRRIVRTGGEI